jgi:hypothetical protein
MVILNFAEILETIIRWEEEMAAFYDRLRWRLTNHQSRELIDILQKEQQHTLEVLRKIDLKEFRRSEFVKNLLDYRKESPIGAVDISAQSMPSEIFDRIISCEEKFLQYYSIVRKVLIFQRSQELMDMLIQFKLGQIKRIKGFIDSPEVVS